MRDEMTTLGDSCQFFNGKAHEKDIDVDGQFVVVNSKFISRDGRVRKFTSKQMFPLFENDIVMVMSDVPNGKALAKCYIIEENDRYSLNQRICAIRTSEFNIRFLYYQLNRHPYLLAFNNGENQSNLRKGDILNCPLWKPTLKVQKKIVELLDNSLEYIDQAKANIEKNIANAKELFQSKLNEIFSQKGDGWEEKTLGEVCNLYQGLAINKKTKYLLVEKSNLPLLRIKDLKNNSHQQYIAEKGYPINALVNENEIIYTRTGSLGLVFRGRRGVLHNNSFKVIPNDSLSNDYLYWWLQHDAFTSKIFALAYKAAQPDISHKLFKKQIISIPILKKQEKYFKIIEKLNKSTNEIINSYNQKMVNLEDLKKSLLQKAFAGELTNPK